MGTWLRLLVRAPWACVTLDAAYWRRVRDALERPRMARGLIVLLVVVHVVQGVVTGRKDDGPLRRSYLLGERLASRGDPEGYAVRLERWVQDPVGSDPPCLEIAEMLELEADLKALEARHSKDPDGLDPDDLEDLADMRRDLALDRAWVVAERRRARAACELADLDRRAARGDALPPGWLEAAIRASLVYEPDGVHRPYPPSFAFAMWPMTILPLAALRYAWYALQLVCLASTLWILSRAASGWFVDGARNAVWVSALVWLILFKFFQRDVAGGQVNLVQAGLCVLALWWNARGKVTRAGFALGFAISIKLTPLLLAAWLVARGHWRTVLIGLGVFGALFVAPITLTGQRVFVANARYWLDGVRTMGATDPFDMDRQIVTFDFGNQSLRNLVHRYLRVYPRDRTAKDDGGARHPGRGYVDFADWTCASADRVARGAQILVVLVAVIACGRRGAHPSSMVYWVEASFAFVLMLLLSPITWKAHFVLLAMPAYLIVAFAIDQRDRVLWGLLLGFIAISAVPNRSFLGRELEDLHLAYYANTVGLLFVLAALVRLRQSLRRLPPSEEGLPPPPGLGS